MKILVYRLGSLGDTILALPCFHALRRAFPAAQITVLTNQPVSKVAPALSLILENTGTIDSTLEYPIGLKAGRELWMLKERIRREQFDLVIHLTAARGKMRSWRDYLFFKACGIGKVIGTPFAPEDLEPKPVTPDRYEWEAQRLFRRVESIAPGHLDDATLWDLKLSTAEIQQAEALLAENQIDEPFIALSVGAKVALRDWGQTKWEQLLRRLASVLGELPLVFFGSTEDRERSQALSYLWPGKNSNLAGRCSPRVTAAVLRQARLFIGHDSGPMHLAGAVGVPCVAIFTARNHPGQWWPRGNQHRIIYHQTECFACGLDECTVQQRKCITSISVDEVANAVLQLAPAAVSTITDRSCA